MSVLAPSPVLSHADHVERPRAGFRRRIAERRRLARHDRRTAQLAELHSARALLADASAVVAAGWIQDGWFAYHDEHGRQQLVGAHNLDEITGRQLTGACLVGAIVHAGGGLPAARTGRVHRALDLSWQALCSAAEPAGYGPSPALRAARVRELTRWNDRPSRTAEDVRALLDVADRVAAGQLAQLGPARGSTPAAPR